MKIYIASSWRNDRQPEVVVALQTAGHDVYDFRNPKPGDQGFRWREVANANQLCDPQKFRDEVLTHPRAREGFESDMNALRNSDACVLVLPCGRSAHLELGWATGQGKRTIVLLTDPLDEPELMYLMNDRLCVSIEEVVEALHVEKRWPVQGGPLARPKRPPGTIADHEARVAYAAYAKLYGTRQTFERLHERGGFGYQELTTLLGHEPKTWVPR